MAAESLSLSRIRSEAETRTGLSDYGEAWFFEPMTALIDAWHSEAELSAAGVVLQRERMVHSLVNRLRLVDTIKRHPEILDEEISVAAVIVGLPRTGSTLFHRLLANSPAVSAIRWWETQSYAPFPDEVRGNPEGRRQHAVNVLQGFVEAGMMSIHPFSIDAPDEEIIILEQFSIGTGPEANAYVPSFARWLTAYDHHPAYSDLKTILKLFQWQEPGRRGRRWVLKTPGHLPTLDVFLDVFPDATVISTHRDPIETVPSYCSMVVSLHGMAKEQVDQKAVGRFTAQRWSDFLNKYIAVRERVGSERFIDIDYRDLLTDPMAQAKSVLARLGLPVTSTLEDALAQWLAENARDKRAPHEYSLEQFGLSADQLARDFARYRQTFVTDR